MRMSLLQINRGHLEIFDKVSTESHAVIFSILAKKDPENAFKMTHRFLDSVIRNSGRLVLSESDLMSDGGKTQQESKINVAKLYKPTNDFLIADPITILVFENSADLGMPIEEQPKPSEIIEISTANLPK